MAYGPRNERLSEKNQDGFVWQYAYDELLRLEQQTDPNGIVRTPTYDNAGRVLFVNFSTGRRDSLNYDNNDNPTSISRHIPGTTTAMQFIYDSLDHVVEQDDALGKTVLYGYDPLSRVTNITYPGSKILSNTYDALGRLTAQTDWAGRQMTYTYDLADPLISRTYPNGVVQTNTFDSAGRISGLNYSAAILSSNSINIALSYAYDRNGNKTGSSESGTINWPQPSLTDDQSSFTPAGRLINRTISQPSTTNSQQTVAYHYDSSGNMTNAAMASGGVTAQSWTLAYDEDNRTTSINWIAGTTNKLVTNLYDALGRRISKTVNGVTTGYVLSLVGGMEKVLCDLDGNGNVTAWYVHGPDLCYKVDNTGRLDCFHADAQANVIACSGPNAELSHQYAYSPYGRVLATTDTGPPFTFNPYTFVGSQGVQEESDIPNLYFMRARYYSADAGIFLSTDPVKHIGPGWQPVAFAYANENPLVHTDPTGQNPAFLAAFLLGWADGSVKGVFEKAAEQLIVESGSSRQDEQLVEIAFKAKSLADTIDKGGKLIEADAAPTGVGVAYFLGDQLSSYTTDPIWNLSVFLQESSANIGGAIGNQLHNVIFGQGQNTSTSTTLNSPTAGTTPMANIPSANHSTGIVGNNGSSANQSLSSQTVGAIGYGSVATVATATPRASPSTQSGSTSSGGSLSLSLGGSIIGSSASQNNQIAGPSTAPLANNSGSHSSSSGSSSSTSSSNPFVNAWNWFTSLFR